MLGEPRALALLLLFCLSGRSETIRPLSLRRPDSAAVIITAVIENAWPVTQKQSVKNPFCCRTRMYAHTYILSVNNLLQNETRGDMYKTQQAT